MSKNKNVKYAILAILAVLIIVVILFFVFNIHNIFGFQSFKDLNFKLPNNYSLSPTDTSTNAGNDYVLYSKDNWIYASFFSSTLTQNSVLDFLKECNFPEENIKQENINNYNWYCMSFLEFGNRYYYYVTEKDGILYELNVWASEDDDQSLLKEDANFISKTLKF